MVINETFSITSETLNAQWSKISFPVDKFGCTLMKIPNMFFFLKKKMLFYFCDIYFSLQTLRTKSVPWCHPLNNLIGRKVFFKAQIKHLPPRFSCGS